MKCLKKIRDNVAKYEILGSKTMPDGSKLVGKAPHVAEQAWLHSLFAPINEKEIKELELQMGRKIPDTYKEFLILGYNGIRLFVTEFSLYGLRKQLGRTIEASVQPFSILTPNGIERPKNALDSYFFIGGYGEDGSKIYLDTKTDKVHYCKRNDATSIVEWKSFDKMLESEVDRIFSLFDKKGELINDNIKVTPA